MSVSVSVIVGLRAAVSRYRGYWLAGAQVFGDITRRIADAIFGRPAVAPVPIRVRR
jgi:hypothetical protein